MTLFDITERHVHRPRPDDDAGQSLVLVIVILLILSVSAGTVASIITSNQSQSGRERLSVHALAAAEAGLDLAANKVSGSDLTCTSTSPCSSTVDGASVTYWATASGATSYTLNSRATSANGKVKKMVQQTLQSSTTSTPGSPNPIWGYGFVMGGAPSPTDYRTNNAVDNYCSSGNAVTIFDGSGAITVPTWIDGDFCASGGSNPAIGNASSASPIPVHIGGTMYDQQGPTCVIGDGSGICSNKGPVASAEIVHGCWNHHAAAMVPCDSNSQTAVNGGSGVYATTFTPPAVVPTPSKPLLDSNTELGIYQSASPGPMHGCTAASTGPPPANLFDTNTTPDTGLGTKAWDTLFGMTHGFDCIGSAGGELKWTPCSSPPCYNGSMGTLYISGTVFIDANLTLGASSTDYVKIDPTSNGSLYVDGTIVFSGDAYLSTDTGTWTNPTTIPSFFMAAFNRSNASYGFQLLNNSRFEGVIYTNKGFKLDNSARNAGSVFADYGLVLGAGKFNVTSVVPDGALGGTVPTTTTTWSVAPRSWRECKITGCS